MEQDRMPNETEGAKVDDLRNEISDLSSRVASLEAQVEAHRIAYP
jgi:outer membrane murein-binding lipoprotein Lpp